MVERRLINHRRVARQELHDGAFCDEPFVVEPVHQSVVPERGPALVHHLRLTLRIEVLRQLADDAHDLTLPRFQQRRMLLDEVKHVLLRLRGEGPLFLRLTLVLRLGQGAPQVVQVPLNPLRPIALTPLLFLGGNGPRTLVAVHAVVHQRMAGIQQIFHLSHSVALFAFRHVFPGKHQIVDDRTGIGPGSKQIIALEERVVAVAGVGDDQRLHREGVLLHQIGDARIRVDHDLVGEPHQTMLILALHRHELLTVRPVVVADGHAHGRVGVHHLIRTNDLDLIRIRVETVFLRQDADLVIELANQVERPVAAGGDGLATFVSGARRSRSGNRFHGSHVTPPPASGKGRERPERCRSAA